VALVDAASGGAPGQLRSLCAVPGQGGLPGPVLYDGVMLERLQKILSRAGIASRRGAEKVMAEGRVTVNGVVTSELGTKADLATDDVRVDGVRIRPPKTPVYLVLNKPKGVVSTRHDPEGRTSVMDLVPAVAGLFPVGRLDLVTEGLILLTNDGAFAERVAHPRYEVPRVYLAKVHGIPAAETLRQLTSGVWVDGELLSADSVRVLKADNNAWLEVMLHEGKNHEVRRLLEAVHHPVSKLRRVAIGPVSEHGLKPGEFRALTPGEIHGLLHPKKVRIPPRPVRAPSTRGRKPQRRPIKPRDEAKPARPADHPRPRPSASDRAKRPPARKPFESRSGPTAGPRDTSRRPRRGPVRRGRR
jgi:23S rRNA pseudouridine2605 synthase